MSCAFCDNERSECKKAQLANCPARLRASLTRIVIEPRPVIARKGFCADYQPWHRLKLQLLKLPQSSLSGNWCLCIGECCSLLHSLIEEQGYEVRFHGVYLNRQLTKNLKRITPGFGADLEPRSGGKAVPAPKGRQQPFVSFFAYH